MYKFVFPLLVSLLSITSFAQKNEVKVMYSPVSLQRMDGWGTNYDGLDPKYSGAFMIDYNRYLKPRLKLGFNASYERKKVSGTKSYIYCNLNPPYDCIDQSYKQSNKESLFFFGPQFGFEYLQKDNFRLGSLVGVSLVLSNREDIVDFITEKESDVNLFFHAELLNFTWGKTNGLTGQLGVGHKGLFSLGYFFRW
ncbi:hypothetical protein SAMN06265379_10898 [Saccharicrinis carchari]|uniref:Outer membrane protein beta-barrel domain-containing protein n=1 Tax=Saccharicrinis carchari TaxID=1168039 RepID=A0A521EBI9_SACCC|nr:hypothetical protein [Saccharicrinis carchari]SMO81277.1 hypothetical protein SAMN06265379_10898 [Saccharicrinis carchari]